MPVCCSKLPPVKSDYVPEGQTVNIGDFEIYETKDKTPNKVLICAYDIFGFHPVTKQVADRLALAGFRVVMPDFFRGKPWPQERYPPANYEDLFKWIGEVGAWEKTVKKDLLRVINHYKENENIKTFGIYGFCWVIHKK